MFDQRDVARLVRVVVLLTVLSVPAAAIAATSRRVLAPNCAKAQYKPAKIVIACGDGSQYLAELKWTSWTSTKATATGAYEINNCSPDCVSGHFHSYPVTVTLSKPMTCKGQRHKIFGQLALLYGSRHPGSKRTSSSRLLCPF